MLNETVEQAKGTCPKATKSARLGRGSPDMRTILATYFDVKKTGSRKCLTCGAATREKKDYCSDHVEQQEYVAALVAKLEAREAEETKIEEAVIGRQDKLAENFLPNYRAGAKHVNPFGTLVEDVLLHLSERGVMTVDGIARHANISTHVAGSVAYFLRTKMKDKFTLTHTKRGAEVIKMKDVPEVA
jgi:hypothetical protein